MINYSVINGQRVIRGKVSDVVIVVYNSGRIVHNLQMDVSKSPFHTNNMDEWLRIAVNEIRDRDLITAYAHSIDLIQYEINDGKGRIVGRGCNDNKFTFRLGQTGWRVEIQIKTLAYAQITQTKYRTGETERRPRVVVKAPRREGVRKWDLHSKEWMIGYFISGDPIYWWELDTTSQEDEGQSKETDCINLETHPEYTKDDF